MSPSAVAQALGGCLTIVGTGIHGVSDFSFRAVAEIRKADVVVYHVFDRLAAGYVRSLNATAIDLYPYYGEGKQRRVTYIQMAEVMLRSVRSGFKVVGVFSGHPGVFVMASRRAISIAREEGYSARMFPAVSSVDCLFADLAVDPGVYGFQIVKAGSVLRSRVQLATGSHVALLQIGSVGDRKYSLHGYDKSKRSALFEKLIAAYDGSHESIYYLSSRIAEDLPKIENRKLSEYLSETVSDALGSGILYLPPKDRTYK
jgi:precorrin-6B methylase 1